MIVTRTPLRISLFGGSTDFPEYYHEHGGAVLGFTLDKYVWITARELPPFFKHKFRIVWSKIELVRNPAEIENPIYRAALADWDGPGLELHYDADLPARSGLGSSSSFTVGLLHALDALRGIRTASPDDIARRAIRLERETLGEAGGHQDQLFAAYGGMKRIDFHRGGWWSVTNVAHSPDLFDHLLLFYTGQQRQASQLESMKVERLALNQIYLRALHQQIDIAQDFIECEDYRSIGELLHQAWSLKKHLAPGVSYPEIDALYDNARRAGAWGGKLLGAGGGGFLLLCTPPSVRGRVREALRGLVEVPVTLAKEGSRVLYDANNLR